MIIPRTVYAMRHNPTGKIYVGSSGDVKKRIKQHLCLLSLGKHKIENLQSDYDTYGGDFTIFKLATISRFEDRYLEYIWMEALHSRDVGSGYNYKDHARPFVLDDCPQIDIT